MKKISRIIYRRILVIAIMMLMVLPMLGIYNSTFSLRERVTLPTEPSKFWNGLVKHEWQSYVEQYFLIQMGSTRAFLILLHNEIKLHLFPNRPNDDYIWTSELGFYPVDSIKRLNGDILGYDAINQHYQIAAGRLRILQEMLSHQGLSLIVVLAPPKARVYPEYIAPYLISPPESIMRQAISYGDVLKKYGVNVLDIGHMFFEKKAASPWPFFTTTSFHWSYWAACGVTNEIMNKAQELTGKYFFKIRCSNVDYGKSKWADTDIASILNVFSTETQIGNAPFPKISPQNNSLNQHRKILIIGDSFSDNIVYALTEALPDNSWSPGWLIRYDGFVSRQTLGMGGKVTTQISLQGATALPEILSKELLLFVVSDGNVYRNAKDLNQMEFGATRALLDSLLIKAEEGGVDPKSFVLQGWHKVGNKQWRTSGHQASLVIRPPINGSKVELLLDVESLSSQPIKSLSLDILLDGELLSKATMAQDGRGLLAVKLPSGVKYSDSLVAEIVLREASGNPLNLLLHGVKVDRIDQEKTSNKLRFSENLAIQKIPKLGDGQIINLISSQEPEDILVVSGLSGLESNGKESWRWALGPSTRIKFYMDPILSDEERRAFLKFSFKNGVPILDQSVTIFLNGTEIRRFTPEEIGLSELTEASILLNAKSGVNNLEISYEDWNHGKKSYGSNDPRKLAIVIMQLSLQLQHN